MLLGLRNAFTAQFRFKATATANLLNTVRPKVKWSSNRIVRNWLFGSAGLVAGIVVLGGLTRLTESGLSMVDWKLIHFKAPQSDAEWQAYFEKYQQYPEWEMHNRGMTLDDFKRIYWMEHAHRVYGRVLGLCLLVPAVFFTLRPGWIQASWLKRRVWAVCALTCFQGGLGWYMVRSGLDREQVQQTGVARVSPYRLASHLACALTIYVTLLHTAFSMGPKQKRAPLQIARLSRFNFGLISLTALAGAFVAGLDAGMIYNDWPRMGSGFIPDDLWNPHLGWRNPFENPACAQFLHRCLAYLTLASTTGLWLYARKKPIDSSLRKGITATAHMGWLQAALGITTLLYSVPISVASLHQTGALALLGTATYKLARL